MQLHLSPADLADPALVRFLSDHLADLAPTAPPESRHALDLGGLAAPGVRVWAVHDADPGEGGRLVATGALAEVEPGHEELKSMRTLPEHRGRGVGARVVAHLLADARSRGVTRVSLETGSMEFFAPARALYARAGFRPCAPFGSYREDPSSVFMTLEL